MQAGRGAVVTYIVTSVVTFLEKRSLSGSRINTGLSAKLVRLGGVFEKQVKAMLLALKVMLLEIEVMLLDAEALLLYQAVKVKKP